MEHSTIQRIGIFIDYENFSISYKENHQLMRGDKIDNNVWIGLNDAILEAYRTVFTTQEEQIVCSHMFTRITAAVGEYETVLEIDKPRLIKRKQQDNKNLKRRKRELALLDRIQRFIVTYGTRNKKGSEKGVDTEIVCQMLELGFQDRYDIAILLSDDADYIPVVKRLEENYGKRVIQAGYERSRLRGACFGHIPLEKMNKFLRLNK